MELDLDSVNASLREASAREVIEWVLGLGGRTIATTSMGRNAAVLLHMVSEVDPSVPTIWVDTGYNLRDTYVVAERLIRDSLRYAGERKQFDKPIAEFQGLAALPCPRRLTWRQAGGGGHECRRARDGRIGLRQRRGDPQGARRSWQHKGRHRLYTVGAGEKSGGAISQRR